MVHIREVVSALRNRGHRVDLVSRPPGRSYITASLLLFFRLLKSLNEYDVIYARDFHTVIIAFLPRRIFKKRLVFEINGLASEEQKLKGNSVFRHILSFSIGRAERIAANYSDRIISVTPQIADYLIRSFNCRPDKVKVVSNGVNTEKFHPIDDPVLLENFRKSLGIGQQEAVVAFVGNLAPWQGVEYLIRVAPSLLEISQGLKYLIVGNGALKGEFEDEVKRLGLSNLFIFTGTVDYENIPLYINIADICVTFKKRLKSGYSPIKLYEYMACGKPVVASRVEGLEFIEAEGAGQLAEPEDTTSLRQVLLDLLRDSEKRVSMGRRGLQIVREKFDWKKKVGEIEKVLEELA